jgi:hypothetical protein
MIPSEDRFYSTPGHKNTINKFEIKEKPTTDKASFIESKRKRN